MTHYLIEFRFQGKSKRDLKKLIYEVDKKFRLGNAKLKRPVPHITIVAPFSTSNQKRLVKDFKQVCENHPLIRFNISGFGSFSKTRVVYREIKPSKELIGFRRDLINKLKSYCILSSTDVRSFLGLFKMIREYHPHATIAMKLEKNKFEKIKKYMDRKRESNLRYTLARVTLIKNKRILYEYDFLLKRLLNRREAKSKRLYTKTINLLKND
ncbi:MAG: 2'-5' RNA ligase family protein [Candidatus Pacearchaeota archaeon]